MLSSDSRLVDGLAQLTSNEHLVLAGTLHGIHAITSRLSPMGSSSGAQVIEGESFKMTILLTATGAHVHSIWSTVVYNTPCMKAQNLSFSPRWLKPRRTRRYRKYTRSTQMQ